MNSYELLRPDGAGTGILACGECHKPHVVAWRANKPVAEASKLAGQDSPAQQDWTDLVWPGANE